MHGEQLALAEPIGERAGRFLGDRRGRFGDAFDDADRHHRGAEHRDQINRQQRVDHLGRDVHQHRHEAERPDAAGNVPQGIARFSELPSRRCPSAMPQDNKTRQWRVMVITPPRRGFRAAPPSRSHQPTAGGFPGTPSPSVVSAYAKMPGGVNLVDPPAKGRPRMALGRGRLRPVQGPQALCATAQGQTTSHVCPERIPLFVVFCLMLALSPCSAVFSG